MHFIISNFSFLQIWCEACVFSKIFFTKNCIFMFFSSILSFFHIFGKKNLFGFSKTVQKDVQRTPRCPPGANFWRLFGAPGGSGGSVGRLFETFLRNQTTVFSALRKNTCLGAFLGLFLESFWSSLDCDVGPWALNKFAKTQNMCNDIYAHIFKNPNNTCCRLRF